MWTVMANLIRRCYADDQSSLHPAVMDVVLLLKTSLHIIVCNLYDTVNNKAICEGGTKFSRATSCLTSQNIYKYRFPGQPT